MEYRRLGNSGLEVSVVGLGTNNFGGRMDAKQTDDVIKKAIDEGINMIDTSNSYGRTLSEEYIGKSVKDVRDQVLLATKVASPMSDGPNMRGTSRKHIMDQVEQSLKRLDTDYLDLYQIHFPDQLTPIEETLRTLDDLVRQGKVCYIGCSNFASWQVAQAMETADALHLEPFVSAQPEYSMLDRRPEAELIPCCEAYGLGFLPFYPLASGFLTGKYKRGEAAPEGARLARTTARSEATLTDANYDLLEALESFTTERDHTMVELAFAWLLGHPVVSSVIAGATNVEQVADNAKAADWHLTPEDMEEINGILDRSS